MHYFFIFLVFLAIAYFLYNISETLIDIKDELRAANRNRELLMQREQSALAQQSASDSQSSEAASSES